MSKVQTLRVFMKQRLTAAAEEIFELFERTIAEYEEELCRQRKLLDAVLQPQVQLHRTDVQQLLESESEDPPEQQDRSTSMDQEEPELPHIKEEQEELWTHQEGEQPPGLEEADIKFTLSPVPVKSGEDDEEKPQSQNSDPDSYLQPVTDDETSHCSEPEIDDNDPEPETDDSSDWEPRKPQVHSEEQGSSCSVLKKPFPSRSDVVKHMTTHNREKPFSCSLCGTKFSQKSSLNTHLKLHERGKPYTCSICQSSFSLKRHLKSHMNIHDGEKPFRCSVCGKGFSHRSELTQHFVVHTGEKAFSCSVCGKNFARRDNLKQHYITHTQEKRYSCSICNKRFTRRFMIKTHKCVGERSQNP